MKKLLITLCLSLMALGGIALCFHSNSDLASLAGMQNVIAKSVPDVCYSCKGSGKCVPCKGRGSVAGAVKRKCSTCKGTGVCQRCKGSGKDPVWKKKS